MEKENYEKFKKLGDYFLNVLRKNYRITSFTISESSSQDYHPEIKCRFSSWGLRKWTMGIWPTGKWSEFYNTEAESKIVIFLIHDWTIDKFRPSSADILFEIRIGCRDEILSIETIASEINEIKKSPIKTYYEISRNIEEKNPIFLYLGDWWFDKKFRIGRRIKYDIMPKILYRIMKFISLFDTRVEKTIVFDEADTIPRYTFGFLATQKFSEEPDSKFKKFYNLYSRFPEQLSRGGARWNVSDFPKNLNEEQLRRRLFKGVYIEQ